MRSSNTKGSATIPLIITIAILVLLSGFYFYSILHKTNPSNTNSGSTTIGTSFSPNDPNGSVYLKTQTQENYQPIINYQATPATSSIIYKASIQPAQPSLLPQSSSPTTIINNTPQTITYSYSPFITNTDSSAPTTNSYAPEQINPIVWPTQTTNTTTPATTTKKKKKFGGFGGGQIEGAGFNWTSLLIGVGTAGVSSLVNSLFSGTSLSGTGSSGSGGGSSDNFGGEITDTTQCTCGDSTLLYIDDVRGQSLELIYEPLVTTLYSHYNTDTGATVMGTYTSGGTCEKYSEETEECESEGNPDGTISSMGTSE